ncbi:BTAD domain-containing putative transcriptional regulator [Streptomyces smyrnaeus]|uniref:AfsR/SARP family transcriptional regulator n=1 Tax=Streptomyces TaxID=1883 RepID=UPI000C1799B8|nr:MULTISPECIES: AfsR/SARP family transcriptional regulator [unclassified Streptomyces]MBQ0866109.1 AfsR/SARP family transcriptional regulator [Streptomyces sp. RK75]MBQ1120144.1 AfsR/SARP family transcriptional regulator [Streptomyces sp. B15]MBQ1162955.1 AfsR/SARP family transcriptional regulator [Streptomyces sp. A73]
MDIDILGPLSVSCEGRTIGVRASKVRAMLATLALEPGHVVSHVELADELWAGHPVGNPRNALQAHATRVRKVLGLPAGDAALLRAVPNGYLLNVSRDRIDGNRFLDHAVRGSEALAGEPERALRHLEAALGLWRGPALLDAGDGLRCRSAGALFEERRLTVWEDLASARLILGDESRAIAELRQLTAQYPLRERFCELLMLALYRTGRQSDALELFRLTQRRLDEELGIQPAEPLQRRHAEILAHDPALSHPGVLWGRREPGRDGLPTG